MFPRYEEINWTHWYKMENFIVFDVPHKWIPFNVFDEIWDFLDEWWVVSNFDENRNVLDSIYSDYILVEYTDENIRNKDINNNSKINIINSLKSEKIDWNKQLAENTWNFEYNWKYYLVLNPYNSFTDETDSERWLYKWVIIDSGKYFWIGEESQNVVSKIVETVEKIID